jgi:serine O-acetyltransferase
MKTSLPAAELASYVARQMSALFPDRTVEGPSLGPFVDDALGRVERCFSAIGQKYYRDEGGPLFDHRHTDQYASFLYFLSNSIHRRQGDLALASKAYALNKALHALDVFYEVELPEIFAFQHPVGTVLGRGSYANYFFVYQRCSIGANLKGEYPRLGEGVVMYGGSAVIGDSCVEGNCWLSMGTIVMDEDVPRDSVVFRRSPSLVIKETRRNVVRDLFSK